MLRPEQEIIALSKDLMRKCSSLREFMDPFAGSFSTSKQCIMVEKDLRLVRCEKDV